MRKADVLLKRTRLNPMSAWRKPIIATTNFSPNELIESAHGGKKTVIAILSRLRRSCKLVQF